MKFKKSLGQNLLIDKNILKKILSLTSFKNKKIIEIGAGTVMGFIDKVGDFL